MARYLKFVGDYSQLKGLGYTFQKLYAMNYMSWNKNGVFIFKKGADVSHGEIDLYNLLSFLDTNPQVKYYPYGISFYTQQIVPDVAHSSNFKLLACSDANREAYLASMNAWLSHQEGDELPPYMGTQSVSHELLAQLAELRSRGWLELAERDD